MIGLVDWAADRARMILAFIILSLLVGGYAYVGLPKEGEPDIEIPALFVSVPFPGISAEDSETLLVKPMEVELADLDGLCDIKIKSFEDENQRVSGSNVDCLPRRHQLNCCIGRRVFISNTG